MRVNCLKVCKEKMINGTEDISDVDSKIEVHGANRHLNGKTGIAMVYRTVSTSIGA